MPRKRHTKESIILTLQNLAKRLGKTTLTKRDVQGVIPVSSVASHFGNLGNALEAAGLERIRPGENFRETGVEFSNEDLLRSLFALEDQLEHEPGYREYSSQGSYSPKPFRRFGKWSDVLAHYRKWKVENGLSGGTSGLPVEVERPQSDKPAKRKSRTAVPFPLSDATPSQLYGEPIDFRGLRHAPINEQGVVYLFGMVSQELGFYIEAIQQGFPDCEGKYLHDAKKNLWAKARIEFEFKASNFRAHGHDPKQCDFVICWTNDWPDCPMTVIELKHEILKLPQT